MSRTLRYNSRWLRTGPATQQERRQYFAALDQEIPIRVRGKRRPNNLPDNRSELRSSSYRQTISIYWWLLKRLGQRWERIQRAAAVEAPNLKPSPRNREALVGYVYEQTYVKDGRLWGIDQFGNHVESLLGFFVDPNNGCLSYRGCRLRYRRWDGKRSTGHENRRGGTTGSTRSVKWQRFAFRKPFHRFPGIHR
jgi:hypothetical protein